MNYHETSSSIFTSIQQNKIRTTLSSIMHDRVKSALVSPEIISSIKSQATEKLDLQATYAIRIKPHLKSRVENGDLHFVTDSKTGLPLGQLADKQGRIRGLVSLEKIVPHKKETLPAQKNNAEKSLERSTHKIQQQNEVMIGQMRQIQLQNAAIMQQLMQITEIVSDIRERVIALQEMHDNDMLGKIYGAQDSLLQIKDTRDAELQKMMLSNVINDLNRDRRSIQQELIWTMEKIPSVPRTSIGTIFRLAYDKNFYDSIKEKYDRAQTLFHLYLTTTLLLGYAYAFNNEPKAYEDVFTPSTALSSNANLIKLINAEKLFVSASEDAWFKNPENYLGRLGEYSQKLFARKDMIELQITGAELQEVLMYGTETE